VHAAIAGGAQGAIGGGMNATIAGPASAAIGGAMLPAIEVSGLAKRYGTGDAAVDALKEVEMSIAPGEVVGLIGPSGSGKTTLLKCLGAVIEPTAGRIALAGETIYDGGWKVADLRALRRDRIGFVFQAPYLIPFLDVTDNVALLPMLAGHANGRAKCSPRSTSRTARRRRWRSSPAASSSACRSRARWSTVRRSFSPTSPRRRSTASAR
jgi:predicted ABC-type transport system involved in lysophospholipase L1 biosynthesis ATPase subunit